LRFLKKWDVFGGKENHKMADAIMEKKLVQDMAAFIRFCNREDKQDLIASTLIHDIMGAVNDDPFFLPRVNGYAEKERIELNL
jgi:hypothetical protein